MNTLEIKKMRVNCLENWVMLEDVISRNTFWAHFLQKENTKDLKVGDIIQSDFAIAEAFLSEDGHYQDAYAQPIKESSSIKVNATVKQIFDDFVLICDVDMLGSDILVNFERKYRCQRWG